MYAFPSLLGLGFLIDNTNLIPILATGTTPFEGTKLGNASLSVYGSNTNTGGVYYSNLYGSGLTIWSEVGTANGGLHGSGLYHYNYVNSSYQFEAMILIVQTSRSESLLPPQPPHDLP